MKVQHDRDHNQLHLIFREDRLVASEEWCASNAIIALAADGEALEITIFNYYTRTRWEFDENFVEKYNLKEHLDDLRLIWENFFAPPSLSVKSIHYEGSDGEEIIVRPGEPQC